MISKKMCCALTLILIVGLSSTAVFGQEVLFEDDFTEPLNTEDGDWIITYGAAWTENGLLIMDPEKDATFMGITKPGFTDFVIEAKIQEIWPNIEKMGGFGFQLRTRRPGDHYANSGYYVAFQADSNKWNEPAGKIMITIFKPDGAGGFAVVGYTKTDIEYDNGLGPIVIKVELKGYNFKVYADDKLLLEAVDEGQNDTPMFNRGYVQLIKQYRVGVAWDYVRITSL